MDNQANQWNEIYSSLQIESLKASGRLMFIISLVAGLIIVAIFFLVFRKYPVAVAFIAVGALIFSGKYAIGIIRLSKNPDVYTGVVVAKNENSRTEESTATSYVSYRITLNATSGCGLTGYGLTNIRELNHKKLRIRCSEQVFNSLTEGDSITVVVMPHDRSIAWFKKNESK